MFISDAKQKSLVFVVAGVAGFLLIFGSTDVSPFELLAGIALLVTCFLIVYKKWYASIPLTTQNYTALAFGIFVFLQLFLLPATDVQFAFATLYVIAVYALIQFWAKKERGVKKGLIYGYVIGAVTSSLLGIGAYLYAQLRGVSTETIRFFWEDSVRISVLFDDPVVYGAFLVPAVLILSVKMFLSEKRNEMILYAVLALLIFSNLVLSGSRGAWLNMLVAAALFALLYRPLWTKYILKRAVGLVCAAAFLFFLIIVVIPLGDRSYYAATLEHRYSSSDRLRIENMRSMPDRISNRDRAAIVLGSGSGTYEKATAQGFSAHNTYLRILYEQGIVGIALYLAFIFFVLMNIVKERSSRPLFYALLVSAVAGILVQNLFVDTLHWRHFWVLIGIVI